MVVGTLSNSIAYKEEIIVVQISLIDVERSFGFNFFSFLLVFCWVACTGFMRFPLVPSSPVKKKEG
jgi:hypothetical protein